MDRVLRFLTSQKTTALAVVANVALLLMDGAVLEELHVLGLSDEASAKLVAAAKLVTLALAALGFSPLRKPTPLYRRK